MIVIVVRIVFAPLRAVSGLAPAVATNCHEDARSTMKGARTVSRNANRAKTGELPIGPGPLLQRVGLDVSKDPGLFGLNNFRDLIDHTIER